MSDVALTNPGRSENVAKQTSLADAIAANLTEGREAQEAASQQPQPRPTLKPEPVESAPEPQAAPEQDASSTPETYEEPAQEPISEDAFYDLHDFAEAADVDVDTFMERLKIPVKDKDGTRTVPLRDAINGYKWDAANTQRSQELAEQRKALEAKREETNAMHAQAHALLNAQWNELNQELAAIDQQYRQVNWHELQARGDGSFADAEAGFARARQDVERRRQNLQRSAQAVEQQRYAQQQAIEQELRPKERAALLDALPQWNDPDRESRDRQAMAAWLQQRYGLEPDWNNVLDHRLTRFAYDAWRLHTQAAAGGEIAEKAVKSAPKPVKPGRRRQREDAKTERVRKLAGRLRNSGNRNDLAELILAQRSG